MGVPYDPYEVAVALPAWSKAHAMTNTGTKLKTTAACLTALLTLARLPIRTQMLTMLCAEWLKVAVSTLRRGEAAWDVLWFYGLSFIATASSCLLSANSQQVRLMSGMQLIWATRLSTFLSIRPPAGSQTGNSYGGVVKKIKSDWWLQLNYTFIAGLWRICTCIPLWLKA